MSFRSSVPWAPRRRGALSALIVVLALLGGLLAGTAHAATENSGVPGKVRFVLRMDETYDQYVDTADQARKNWFNEKFWRMEVFTPNFDVNKNHVSWYPNGWVYSDSYAIKRGDDAVARDAYILRDTGGKRLYLDYQCGSEGGCPQYAADITNPAFRKDWIANLTAALAKGYRGAWIDDVNLDMKVTDIAGNPSSTPYSPSLGRVITAADWRKAMATFMEEVRAAVPADKEILHNSLWFNGRDYDNGAAYYPEVERQIKAADYINVERGVNDGGLTGGSWVWSLTTLHAYMDKVHALGRGVVIDARNTTTAEREYSLANYLLISNGRDAVGDMSQTPDNWWRGWDTDLGQPTAGRYGWQGLLRRDFAGGIALVNEPQAPTRTVALPEPMKTTAGAIVSTVTLPAGRGAVLSKIAAGPKVTGVRRVVFGANVIAIISGSGFTDATEVRFGSVAASTILVNDDGEVLAIEPAQPTGSVVDLRVVTPTGVSPVTAADRWTYLPFPRITSISKASGPESGGTYVIVSGTDLAGAKVTVGGVPASSYSTSTRVIFFTPPGTGTQTVVITTPDGVAKTRFKYLAG